MEHNSGHDGAGGRRTPMQVLGDAVDQRMEEVSKASNRRIILWTATGLGVTTNIPLIALLGVMTADFASQTSGIKAIAGAACGCETLSLGLFGAMAIREYMVKVPNTVSEQGRLRARRRIDVLTNAIGLSISGGMTVGTLGWMGSILLHLQKFAGMSPSTLLVVGVVFVVLTIIFETTAIVSLVFGSRESSSIVVLPPADMIEAQAHWSDTEAPLPVQRPPFAITRDPPKTPDSSTVSFRSSLTGSTKAATSRPGSSKNFGSSRPTSSSQNSSKHPHTPSRPSSSSQSSQLDTWDTSTVPPGLRDTIHSRNGPPHKNIPALPPIPGSRPASPAKALDGPFLPDSPHPSQLDIGIASPALASEKFYSPPTSPVLGQRPVLHNSASIESIPRRQFSPPPIPERTESPGLPRSYSQASLADSVSHLSSRRITAVPSEENIHPLFRASSATPPPATTLNTVVTAASIEDALGKRRSASAEALRTRALADRAAGTLSARASTKSRLRSAGRELNSPLLQDGEWFAEQDEPPSPERKPPNKNQALRAAVQEAMAPSLPMEPSLPTPEIEDEEGIPDYMVHATADPQFAAYNRFSTAKP